MIKLSPTQNPFAAFHAVERESGAFCLLAGRPIASSAPAGAAAEREFTVAGALPFARLLIDRRGAARLEFSNGASEEPQGAPFEIFAKTLARFRQSQSTTTPGCVLALAYDAAPWTVPVRFRQRRRTDADEPLLVASFYEAVLEHNSLTGQTFAMTTGFAPDHRLQHLGTERAQQLADAFEAERVERPAFTPRAPERVETSFDDEAYLAAIEAVQRYIAAGDVYQVNLAQRLRLPLPTDVAPWELWLRMARQHPTAWSAYYHMGERAGVLLSNSPECFAHLREGELRTYPIKGTRRVDPDPEKDAALVEELRTSAKELAEHRMIVDLERNDVGRISRIGTVSVPAREYVETYGTLHHLVSCVCGEVDRRHPFTDVLKALFPGGSITGAPKKRALEIIDELEPVGRGFYTGILGTLTAGGSADFSILIRTAHLRNGFLEYGVGGGIVADSSPKAEVEESWLKARAFLAACGFEGRAPTVCPMPAEPPVESDTTAAPGEPYVVLGGTLVPTSRARISALDRGFLYGDGAFSTLRAVNGRVAFFESHFARLQSNLAALNIPLPWEGSKELLDQIVRLLKANRLTEGEALVRVQVSRGVAGKLGLTAEAATPPTVLVLAGPLSTEVLERRAKGVSVVAVEGLHAGGLSQIKLSSYLKNLLCTQTAQARGADEGVFVDVRGFVSEASTANLFFVKGGKLCTPALEVGALPGITRKIILEIAAQEHIPFEEGRYKPDEIKEADEIFLSSSVTGITPVHHFEGAPVREYERRPATRRLAELLEKRTRERLRP